MPTTQILQYLKTNGESLDTKIAEATGITLSKTRIQLADRSKTRLFILRDFVKSAVSDNTAHLND